VKNFTQNANNLTFRVNEEQTCIVGFSTTGISHRGPPSEFRCLSQRDGFTHSVLWRACLRLVFAYLTIVTRRWLFGPKAL
jgi:hypothetical protein